MALTFTFDPGAVVIAGGSGGIGEVIAKKFAAEQCPVVLTYHGNETKASAIKADIESRGGRCDIYRLDLRRAEEVDRLLESVRTTHTRVANVIYAAGPHFDFSFIGGIPNEHWHHVVDTDINGAFHLIQAAVRTFRAQGDGGNLLALITCAVERVPVADILSAAPKAAIEMLIRGVAKEAGRFGIRANCVGPGWINAGIGKKGIEEKLDDATREHIRKKTIPLQRFGEPEDIAHAAMFLCSTQANFITGQSLAVDGGLQL